MEELSLDQIRDGQICQIKGYRNQDVPVKIIEMGLLPATEVKILRRAPFKGPLCVEFGLEKSRAALRLEEAKYILVQL